MHSWTLWLGTSQVKMLHMLSLMDSSQLWRHNAQRHLQLPLLGLSLCSARRANGGAGDSNLQPCKQRGQRTASTAGSD